MMEREFFEALGIDLVGLSIYGGLLTTIVDPPLGLSSRQLILLGLLFPLISYEVTNRRYEEQFWTAFGASLIIGFLALSGGLWLYFSTVI